MIVEDSPTTAKLIEVLLKKKNYDTLKFNSVNEALKLLFSSHDVDLVITDINMPGVDGVTFIKALRSSTLTVDIPIIVCSSESEAILVKQVISMGCKHYLIKPVQPLLLLTKVAEVLNERIPVLKPQATIMAMFHINEEEYGALLETFTTFIVDQLKPIEDALSKNEDYSVVNLQRITEEASVVGAEKLLNLIKKRFEQKFKPFDNFSADELKLLQREIRILLSTIKSV